MKAIINTRHSVDKSQVFELEKIGFVDYEVCSGDLGNFSTSGGTVKFTETIYHEVDGKRVATGTKTWTLKRGDALVWSVPATMQGTVYPLLLETGVRPITLLTEGIRIGVDNTGKPIYDHPYVGMVEKVEFVSRDELLAGRLPQSQR